MALNQPILKNAEQDKLLLDEGFVVIPFLQTDEVKRLKEYFQQTHPEVPKGLYATAHNPDTDMRGRMNDFIKEVFQRANEENFINCQALGGTYMVKSPGQEGKLYPHQDWNIVDEEHFRSFNVWVPLVDVNAHNGSIQVLPKSHQMVKSIRSINIDSAFDQVHEESWGLMDTLEMKAGEALVYDHRLLHASNENKSESNRLVVVYGIIPDNAEMRYYYPLQEGKIGEYDCNAEFYLKGNPAAGPAELKLLQEIDYRHPKVSLEQLGIESKPQEIETSSDKSLWQRITSVFSGN